MDDCSPSWSATQMVGYESGSRLLHRLVAAETATWREHDFPFAALSCNICEEVAGCSVRRSALRDLTACGSYLASCITVALSGTAVHPLTHPRPLSSNTRAAEQDDSLWLRTSAGASAKVTRR